MTELPVTYSVEQVAAALGEHPRYVKDRVRAGDWPCRKGSRGKPRFTVDDFARILELIAAPEVEKPTPRMAFAPRSKRGAA